MGHNFANERVALSRTFVHVMLVIRTTAVRRLGFISTVKESQEAGGRGYDIAFVVAIHGQSRLDSPVTGAEWWKR